VFIRYPEPQLKGRHFEPQLRECHVLNPYPKQQLKGIRSEPQLKEHQQPTLKRYHRSLVDHASQIKHKPIRYNIIACLETHTYTLLSLG